jgi:heme-degrading monooxygenase HmoA
MRALLIRHKVIDYETWLPGFDEQEAIRRAHGCQHGRLFRNVSDPNEILMLLEWDDLERARLFAQSDDLREELRQADVVDNPDVWFLGAANRAPG